MDAEFIQANQMEDTFNVYYLDSNNVIVDACVFSLDASQELLNDALEIKKQHNPTIVKMITSIDYGRGGKDWDLYKGYLRIYCDYPSWTWDDELKEWQPPVPRPSLDLSLDYWWNESTLEWVMQTPEI
jgi:hypothetical protein